MSRQRVNLITLKPLHVIGKYMGIWPAFNLQTMEKCQLHHIYGFIVLLVLLAISAFNTWGKFRYVQHMDLTVVVTNLLSDLAIIITNVSAIVNINFLKSGRLHNFLQSLQNVDCILRHVNKDEKRLHQSFYIELAIGHVLYVVYVVYNVWVWQHTFGWEIAKYTIVRDVQFYHIFIMSLLVRNYVLLIWYKLQAINYVLERHHVDNLYVISRNISACSQKSGARDAADWNLDFVGAIYTKLTHIVNEFNEIFGCNLVFLQINLIANLLSPLNLVLVYGHGEQFLGISMDYNLYIICAIWFIVPLLNGLAIVSACDKAKKEALRMPMICYNLILENKDVAYIQKLKELALQGHVQSPSFSAAGFFDVNYSLVFPTMTTIISYVIVLVQFRSDVTVTPPKSL